MLLSLAVVVAAQAATPAPAPTAPAAPSSPTSACKVAVMDLENQGLPAESAHLPKVLTEALAATIAEASHCEVITRADIASMVDFEAERAACGGEVSDSCLSEIGNALGVEKAVAGSVSRLGTTTTVTARLMNMKAGKVDARAEESTSDDTQLRVVAQNVGKKLYGLAPTPTTTTTTTTPPPAAGPSWGMVIGGGAVSVAGLAAAGIGAALAVSQDAVLGDGSTSTAEKDEAKSQGMIGVVVAGAGAAGVVVGAVVAVIGLME